MPELFVKRNCDHPNCSRVSCTERYWYLTDTEIAANAKLVEEYIVIGQKADEITAIAFGRRLGLPTLKGSSLNQIATAVCKRLGIEVRKEDIKNVVERAKSNLAARRWYENSC